MRCIPEYRSFSPARRRLTRGAVVSGLLSVPVGCGGTNFTDFFPEGDAGSAPTAESPSSPIKDSTSWVVEEPGVPPDAGVPSVSEPSAPQPSSWQPEPSGSDSAGSSPATDSSVLGGAPTAPSTTEGESSASSMTASSDHPIPSHPSSADDSSTASLGETTFGETTFGETTFGETALGETALGETALGETVSDVSAGGGTSETSAPVGASSTSAPLGSASDDSVSNSAVSTADDSADSSGNAPQGSCGDGVFSDNEQCCTESVISTELGYRGQNAAAALDATSFCAPKQTGTTSGGRRLTYEYCASTCANGETGCETSFEHTQVVYEPSTRTVYGVFDATLLGTLTWSYPATRGTCEATVALPEVEFIGAVTWDDDPRRVTVTVTNLHVDVTDTRLSGCFPRRPPQRAVEDIDFAALLTPVIGETLSAEFSGPLGCPY